MFRQPIAQQACSFTTPIYCTANMDSLNGCWFCPYQSTSPDLTCPAVGCGAQQIPTTGRNLLSNSLIYNVLSFGQRADDLHCTRLHTNWLDIAIDLFQSSTSVAVRVGVKPNFAIIIKDANGIIRGTTRITPGVQSLRLPLTNNEATDLLNVARIILQTDPNQDKGKTTLSTSRCYSFLRKVQTIKDYN